jgi:glycosyltransferase involved in cell wall biosynthesis
MKVLSLTTVFPNAAQPTHGVFVFERLRHLGRHAELKILAPVPWRVRSRSDVPYRDTRAELPVVHPTFFYVPGILKVLDGLFLFLSVLPAVRRLRRTFDFDVIDAHFAFPEGFAAALLSAWYRRPFTITMRGTEILIGRHRLRKLAIRWALRRANRVIAVADPLAAFAISLGVPPDRVCVIENGVNTDTFQPMAREAARELLGLRVNGPLIVSVGHLSARKGFQRVIRVLPELLRTYPTATFAVVGGPGGEANNKPALDALVKALGLEERVLFAGAQPPARVAEWLGAADLFVLASDYEGCPNVVLEALACGRPVVATRVGHVDRMVPDYAGVLVDKADDDIALAGALGEALSRSWDTERIRGYAAGQSWEGVAARVMEQWQLASDAGYRQERRPQIVEMRIP